MEYKVVTSHSPANLSETINLLINEGWEPIGSHQVVLQHSQNRYSGSQHMDTLHKFDYSQTRIKKDSTPIK